MSNEPVVSTPGDDDVLLRVDNVVKYFPVSSSQLFRRQRDFVHADLPAPSTGSNTGSSTASSPASGAGSGPGSVPAPDVAGVLEVPAQGLDLAEHAEVLGRALLATTRRTP